MGVKFITLQIRIYLYQALLLLGNLVCTEWDNGQSYQHRESLFDSPDH